MSDQSSLPANIPLLNTPFVDQAGMINMPWYLLLLQLFRRTGGGGGTPTPPEIVNIPDETFPAAVGLGSDDLTAIFGQLDATFATVVQDAVNDALANEINMMRQEFDNKMSEILLAISNPVQNPLDDIAGTPGVLMPLGEITMGVAS